MTAWRCLWSGAIVQIRDNYLQILFDYIIVITTKENIDP